MVERVLRPQGKGFILLDSHPGGCARIVDEMIAEATGASSAGEVRAAGPTALVIGCSAGYGLATATVGLFGHGARVVGLCYERPATARRSASAGWYRIAALASKAAEAGLQFEPMNGDCFHPAVRAEVLDRAAASLGQIDMLIYSVAAPRRTDPQTGEVHHSAVKPIGGSYQARNLVITENGPSLRDAALEPATDAEIEATIKVMGGEDWADWVADMAGRGMLAPGFTTAALTYVGSDLTAPIYRQGTIGRAKDHLEATAGELRAGVLASTRGTALTSANGAAVTLSSLAIPGISLYLSLLHDVAGNAAQSPVQHSVRLWDYLIGRSADAVVDERGRLRLDDWELAPSIQNQLRERWSTGADEVLSRLAEPDWFSTELLRLYGFGVSGIDYDRPVEVDSPWP